MSMGGMFRRTVGWGVAGVGMFYIILVCFGMFFNMFGVCFNQRREQLFPWVASFAE